MRPSPRTCPSIRFSRLSTDVLALACMTAIYPYRVSVARNLKVVEHSANAHGGETTATDPVCGMKVVPAATKHRHTHDGHAYVFCSAGCRGKFVADPERYLARQTAKPPPPAPAGTIYTCPMHPEIRQTGPGACPICGMALEPEAGGEDDGGELADMTRRLWISAILALPIVALEIGGHFGFSPLPHRMSSLVQLALATPVVLWGGWPFFVRGAQSLRTRHLNMFTLIAWGPASPTSTASSRRLRPDFSLRVPRRAWRPRALLRGGRRHHGAGAAWTSTRTARPRIDVGGNPRVDRSLRPTARGGCATVAAMRMCGSKPS